MASEGLPNLNPTMTAFIKCHIGALAKLPAPGELWVYEDLSPEAQALLDPNAQLVAHSVVSPVGETDDGVTKYRTEPRAWRAIEYWERRIALLPCGHRPFSNPVGIDGYECLNEHCEQVFARETVEQVLG